MARKSLFVLLVSTLCLILSLGVAAYAMYATDKMVKEQQRFEREVAAVLDKYTYLMENLLARQTHTENIVIEGKQLRLTLNEIEQYNNRHAPRKRLPRASKNLPIGGGP